MDKTEYAKSINDYITGYIKVADAKIAAYITIGTTASAFAAPGLYKWLSANPIDLKFSIFWLLFVFATLSFLLTLFCTLKALSPRAKEANSLVSFPDIADYDPDEYADKFGALSEEELQREYCKHNVALSSITVKKYYWLGSATKLSYVWITLYILLYFIYAVSAL